MDNLEYIDAYFQNLLTLEEREAFEKKCVEEKSFAEDVAFYASARKLIKEELVESKQQSWQDADLASEEDEPVSIQKNKSRFTWVKYAVAACLALAIATLIFERPVGPKQLANNYVVEHFTTLGQTMGVDDKFGAAKETYNNRDYKTALAIFEAVLSEQPQNAEAMKYIGIVALQMDKYDKALGAFDMLAKIDLKANPGLFLQAVTLLKRNGQGDEERAKHLLQTVVDQQEEGSSEAKEWLTKF